MAIVLLRRLDASEWMTLWQVRLEALRSDPEAFESTVDDEEHLTDEDWVLRLPRRIFAFVDGETVGIVGWAASDKTSPVVQLIGMWVHPAYRGSTIAQELVVDVQAIATGSRCELVLSVRADNPRALGLYERCGFVVTGEEVGRRSRETLLEMAWRPEAGRGS